MLHLLIRPAHLQTQGRTQSQSMWTPLQTAQHSLEATPEKPHRPLPQIAHPTRLGQLSLQVQHKAASLCHTLSARRTQNRLVHAIHDIRSSLASA